MRYLVLRVWLRRRRRRNHEPSGGGGIRGPNGQGASWTATAPAGLTHHPHLHRDDSSGNVGDGHGWWGEFFWNGGPGLAGRSAPITDSFSQYGCCQASFNNQTVGWFISCAVVVMHVSPRDLNVGGVDLTRQTRSSGRGWRRPRGFGRRRAGSAATSRLASTATRRRASAAWGRRSMVRSSRTRIRVATRRLGTNAARLRSPRRSTRSTTGRERCR